MMKYRIKIEKHNNGVTEYIPQWKRLFFWHNFQETYNDTDYPKVFNTMDKAEKYLKDIIDYQNKIVSYKYYGKGA